LDPAALRFERWVKKKGTQFTLQARSEGAVDQYGDPAITYTPSTVYGFIHVRGRELIQTSEGLFSEETLVVDIPLTQTINAQDKITVGSADYEVGPVQALGTHKRFEARRMVPVA